MALQAKVIKQKIKGVSNIRKITRTMEMVSVSKMKKAVNSALLLRPYAHESLVLMKNVIKRNGDSHILTQDVTGTKKSLYIIIASNKGLCGSFNTNVYREFSKRLQVDTEIEAITIGKQAEKIAKRANVLVKASFVDWGDNVSFEDTYLLTQIIIDEFKSGAYTSVVLVYTDYIKAMSYLPKSVQILPAGIENVTGIMHDTESTIETYTETLVEPTEAIVLDTVIPRVVHAAVHSAVLESLASEHSSRMFAMNTATENAKEMLKILNITYNRARQDSVTQELAEIAAGAGSVK